nr:MAG TPA: hypothetical protein [Caudoviricetes sp.]
MTEHRLVNLMLTCHGRIGATTMRTYSASRGTHSSGAQPSRASIPDWFWKLPEVQEYIRCCRAGCHRGGRAPEFIDTARDSPGA